MNPKNVRKEAVADDVEAARQKLRALAGRWSNRQDSIQTATIGTVDYRKGLKDATFDCQTDLELFLSEHSNAAGGPPVNPTPSSVEHVQQMERDAERYRFLRDRSDPDAEQPYIAQERTNSWGKWLSVPLTAEECDAVIDQLLSSQDGSSPATSVSSPESAEEIK